MAAVKVLDAVELIHWKYVISHSTCYYTGQQPVLCTDITV